MAVTAKWYGLAFKYAFQGEINVTGTVKCMLTTSSYTPDQDAHYQSSDVTNEVSGTGYTAGGATLSNVAITYTGATNTLKIDCDDIVWPSSTITARIAVIYDAANDFIDQTGGHTYQWEHTSGTKTTTDQRSERHFVEDPENTDAPYIYNESMSQRYTSTTYK